MKSILAAMVLLAGFAQAQADDWYLVTASKHNPTRYYYYKQGSMSRPSPGVIKFWLKTFQKGDAEGTYNMEMFYAHCQQKLFFVSQRTVYVGGQIDRRQGFEEKKIDWSEILPDSIAEGVVEKMCSRAALTELSKDSDG